MNFDAYSYILGAATLWFCQWISLIPFNRRHRVVMALLSRANMYRERAEKLSEAGKEEEALAAWQECNNLVAQVRELNGWDKK